MYLCRESECVCVSLKSRAKAAQKFDSIGEASRDLIGTRDTSGRQ